MTPSPEAPERKRSTEKTNRFFFGLEVLTALLIVAIELTLALKKYEHETPFYAHALIAGTGFIIGLYWELLRRLELLSHDGALLERIVGSLRLLSHDSQVVDKVRESLKLLEASSDAAHLRHKERLITQLQDLALKGEVWLYQRNEVYAEDVQLIRALGNGDVFSATVIVAQDPEDQFRNVEFQRFIKVQKEACQRGVKVERFYICEDVNEIRNEVVRSHLDDLISQDSFKENLTVYILDLKQFKRRAEADYNRQDLVAFGKGRVSRGTFHEFAQVAFFARYTCDPKEVDAVLDHLDSIRTVATPYSKLVRDSPNKA